MENFAYGAISGMFGLVLSHPFDTIKTCIQENKQIKYNLRHLYKGIHAPMLGIGIEKSIVFGTYVNLMSHMKETSLNPYFQTMVCGAVAGFNASFIVTPYEKFKILFQTGKLKNYELRQFRPSFLMNGLSATFTREVPGFAIYFTVYEYLKNECFRSYDKPITKSASFLFGGLSGLMAWLFIYPQDRIKTRIQSNMVATQQGFMSVLYDINAEGGVRQFYRGFHYALMRAVPLHAGTFCMMEILTSLGNGKF